MSRGAKVDEVTNDGWSPLHSACRWNHADAAARLLDHGADVNKGTNSNQTPLHIAASEKNSRDLLLLLLTHEKIDTSIKNNVGETSQELCQRYNAHSNLFNIVHKHVNCLK